MTLCITYTDIHKYCIRMTQKTKQGAQGSHYFQIQNKLHQVGQEFTTHCLQHTAYIADTALPTELQLLHVAQLAS